MMGDLAKDHVLIYEITLCNFLSFGSATPPLALGPLNVFIGPNGSGKSNLVEAFGLLRATPKGDDLRAVISRGGGVSEWIWKGAANEAASIEVIVANPKGSQPLRYTIAFRAQKQTFQIDDERIENKDPYLDYADPYFYYKYQHGSPVINTKGVRRELEWDTIDDSNLSILSQRKDPDSYPEITYLANVYERIRLFREWSFGRNAVFRAPQKADMRNDRLEEDLSNLGLYLNQLRRKPAAKRAILTALRDLYEGLTDFDVSVEAGTVQVFFTEDDFTFPATRLSDGTLRYLFLAAVLNDPEPPPLICIEEPELGLHPDILPKLADMIVSASKRTQMIVTTQSDILVDSLSELPEAVIVCEKHAGQTTLQRLEPEKLAHWLEKYTLGQLWTRGELGGTRW